SSADGGSAGAGSKSSSWSYQRRLLFMLGRPPPVGRSPPNTSKASMCGSRARRSSGFTRGRCCCHQVSLGAVPTLYFFATLPPVRFKVLVAHAPAVNRTLRTAVAANPIGATSFARGHARQHATPRSRQPPV